MRIVAKAGGKGAVYEVWLLGALPRASPHLSRWAEVALLKEANLCPRDIDPFASVVHFRVNQGTVLVSGLSRHDGMTLAAR